MDEKIETLRAQEIKDNPPIVTDEKELRQKSRETSKEECDELRIWDKLRNALSKTNDGVGLAAVQIGYPIRAALALLENKGKKYQHCLLNPEVLERSKEMIKFRKEGCLSFPKKYINTSRHLWIMVKDELNGTVKYVDFESIVVQHELDHLDGIL